MSSLIGPLDVYLFGEGTHTRLYDKLGAHPMVVDGEPGVAFAVWAPNARAVSVVGDFNGWDPASDRMTHAANGIWETFVRGAMPGAPYKYAIDGAHGGVPLHADPFAFRGELPPADASIVTEPSAYRWNDAAWLARRGAARDRNAPVLIYEAHLGSWRRADGNRFLTYRELADVMVPYVRDLGFTHIELLPITEFPFDGSWGYQPIGLFAPTSRFGSPDDLRAFIDRAHQDGIGVLLDWVAAHFPMDAHGLGLFDGTHLYEHADPRRGFHHDWQTAIFNYGRHEVANYLLASAMYWLREFHIDGLRVDAVSSMIYLDYSRQPGEWIPNEFGGNENLEATSFLRRLNETVYREEPSAVMIAEESTAWPNVSAPTSSGGLGFSYKWNMGWMHDTLDHLGRDPLYRGHHLDEITFSTVYAWSENYVLPLSHDEVVHGKRSLLGRMPGTGDDRFANLRLLYAYMYAHPGKKLLFMGSEIAQEREWDHRTSLDWHLLDDPAHAAIARLIADLNHRVRATPALYERDCEPQGFAWIEHNDSRNAVIAFLRRGFDDKRVVIVAVNLSGRDLYDYRLGVPHAGTWRETFNSDAQIYGGRNHGNLGTVVAEPMPMHGREASISIVLPRLSVLFFESEPGV